MRYIFLIFFISLISCSPEVEGCMDVAACNYNCQATENLDICIYPENAYDCNGNPSDFRAQYLGLWSFKVDWFMASLHIGGTSDGTYFYSDSIIATDVTNQLSISYNSEGQKYYLIVDENGNLTLDFSMQNIVDFESYFINSDSLYMYTEWEYNELDGNAWGYNEFTASKLN